MLTLPNISCRPLVVVTSSMQKLAERTALECAKVGKDTVELKGYETYSDLAPSDVLVYVI